jgi:hypothetical protein
MEEDRLTNATSADSHSTPISKETTTVIGKPQDMKETTNDTLMETEDATDMTSKTSKDSDSTPYKTKDSASPDQIDETSVQLQSSKDIESEESAKGGADSVDKQDNDTEPIASDTNSPFTTTEADKEKDKVDDEERSKGQKKFTETTSLEDTAHDSSVQKLTVEEDVSSDKMSAAVDGNLVDDESGNAVPSDMPSDMPTSAPVSVTTGSSMPSLVVEDVNYGGNRRYLRG